MNLKVKMIKDAVIRDNKNYKIFSNVMLRDYIKTQYMCTTYLANQVIKALRDDTKRESK
jgi:hypothetical protein